MTKQESRVVVASAPDEDGTLTISQTVLAEIAVTEASATEGVVLGREAGRKGKGPPAECVAVRVDGHEALFELRIGVRHGLRMPDVADALRQRLVEAVRAKTGYTVRAVNIVIERIVREQAAPAEP